MEGDPLAVAAVAGQQSIQQIVSDQGVFSQSCLPQGHYLQYNVAGLTTTPNGSGVFTYNCNDSHTCDAPGSGGGTGGSSSNGLLAPTADFKAAVESLPQPDCGPEWDVWCRDPLSTDKCGCGSTWTFRNEMANASYEAFFSKFGTHYQQSIQLGYVVVTIAYGKCAHCGSVEHNSSATKGSGTSCMSRSWTGKVGEAGKPGQPECSPRRANCSGCNVLYKTTMGIAGTDEGGTSWYPLVTNLRPLSDYIYF
eukprot:SAG31_NODE_4460_length_3214_cov_1.382665_1_plen_250_part_10